MKKGVVCQHFPLESFGMLIVENIQESLFQEVVAGPSECRIESGMTEKLDLWTDSI